MKRGWRVTRDWALPTPLPFRREHLAPRSRDLKSNRYPLVNRDHGSRTKACANKSVCVGTRRTCRRYGRKRTSFQKMWRRCSIGSFDCWSRAFEHVPKKSCSEPRPCTTWTSARNCAKSLPGTNDWRGGSNKRAAQAKDSIGRQAALYSVILRPLSARGNRATRGVFILYYSPNPLAA